MGGRMVWAALLGGVVLFLWGFVSHSVVKLSENQYKTLRVDDATAQTWLAQNAPEHGVYRVPTPPIKDDSDANKAAWEEKYKLPGRAFLVIDPRGNPDGLVMSKHLVREFATCVAMALIAVFLVVVAGGLSGLVPRIVFCVLLAGFAFLMTDVRMRNWDHFPTSWTVAQLIDKLVGGVLLGVVIHLCMPKR